MDMCEELDSPLGGQGEELDHPQGISYAGLELMLLHVARSQLRWLGHQFEMFQ